MWDCKGREGKRIEEGKFKVAILWEREGKGRTKY